MQPLTIVDLSLQLGGRIALSGVPGLLIHADGSLGLCEQTLAREMTRLKQHDIALLVGLVEDEELGGIAYDDIADAARNVGIQIVRLPLRDFRTPTHSDEPELIRIAEQAADLFRQGRGLAFHCIAGIGRSGLMAGCLLVHIGMPPYQALETIRAVLPDALETEEQVRFLLSRRPAAMSASETEPHHD